MSETWCLPLKTSPSSGWTCVISQRGLRGESEL